MKRCRCCRGEWPLEFYPTYRFRGVEYRRQRCLACRTNCKPGSRPARNRAYRAHLRSQVEAVRAARTSLNETGVRGGVADRLTPPRRYGPGNLARLEVAL